MQHFSQIAPRVCTLVLFIIKENGELRGESVSHELCTCMAVLDYLMMEFLLFMSENESVHVE